MACSHCGSEAISKWGVATGLKARRAKPERDLQCAYRRAVVPPVKAKKWREWPRDRRRTEPENGCEVRGRAFGDVVLLAPPTPTDSRSAPGILKDHTPCGLFAQDLTDQMSAVYVPFNGNDLFSEVTLEFEPVR